MKFRNLILLLALAFGVLTLSASNEYKISVKAKQLKSDSLFLGYYYCGKLYVQDTLSLDKNGRGVFSDKELLKEGTYVLYFHGSKYFDLLIGEDQDFSVEIADTLSLPESVLISGASVSEDFHNYSLKLKEFLLFHIFFCFQIQFLRIRPHKHVICNSIHLFFAL